MLAYDTSLPDQHDHWYTVDMEQLRKITVEVPAGDLERAQEFTGAGVTETVRAALRKLASIRAQQQLLDLQGKVKFEMTIEEMKYDRE